MQFTPDSDEPPPLVVAGSTDGTVTGREDAAPGRVPITIITGTSKPRVFRAILMRLARLSRRREDDSDELHIERAARQEDCRNTERLVWTISAAEVEANTIPRVRGL